MVFFLVAAKVVNSLCTLREIGEPPLQTFPFFQSILPGAPRRISLLKSTGLAQCPEVFGMSLLKEKPVEICHYWLLGVSVYWERDGKVIFLKL